MIAQHTPIRKGKTSAFKVVNSKDLILENSPEEHIDLGVSPFNQALDQKGFIRGEGERIPYIEDTVKVPLGLYLQIRESSSLFSQIADTWVLSLERLG